MIGKTISKYQILEIIGRGTMGIVFRAKDLALGHPVALKIIAEKLVDDPEMLQRFEREGGAASALRHPNICTVFESGNWQGRPYLAMELLNGQPLDQRLTSGPIPYAQVMEIAVGVASALEAVHAIGVVHRDIKPANLFLTDSGRVKILDFGLAKVRPRSVPYGDDAPTIAMHMTRRNTILGTLAYMSPEQVCCEPVDARSDLYSLGIVIYELATGNLPSRPSPYLEVLPPSLAAVVGRLMASDPRQRFQSAQDLREALQPSHPR